LVGLTVALAGKVLSSSGDYAEAIVRGASELMAAVGIGAADLGELIHGTTVATNAIPSAQAHGLTPQASATSPIRITGLSRLYDIDFGARPGPGAAAARGARERLGPGGEVLTPLDAASARAAVGLPTRRGRRVDRDRVSPRARAAPTSRRPRRSSAKRPEVMLTLSWRSCPKSGSSSAPAPP
jgi:hypothetical protein